MSTPIHLPQAARRGLLLIVGLLGCVVLSRGQVQNNIGFSQQVLPALTVEPTSDKAKEALKVIEARRKTVEDSPENYQTPRLGVVVSRARMWKYGILADGDFSKATGDKTGTAPTTGSIGVSITSFLPVTYTRYYDHVSKKSEDQVVIPEKEVLEPHLDFQASLSLGGRGDTLVVEPDPANPQRALNQRAFGQSLLLPGARSGSIVNSFGLSLRYSPFSWWVNKSFFRSFSVGGNLNYANTRWAAPRASAKPVVSEFTVVTASGRIFYQLANTPAKDADDLALRVDLFGGVTYRSLQGDIRTDVDLIRAVLGGPQDSFYGAEWGVLASVNALRVTATYYRFGYDVKGLSHGQIVVGVGFSNAFRFSKARRMTAGSILEEKEPKS